MSDPLHQLPNLTEIIDRSQARSAGYGIDPQALSAPESSRLKATQLEERIREQQDFYDIAREQLDNLYRLLKNTGFCMALADKEGYVLYVKGDPDLVEHFKRRRCIPGYRWTERDIGTCAIGLVVEERIPVFLPGDRMFAALAQKISNAGAPVFSPDGSEMRGVVSLSGYSEKMHIHTLGLVRQAAETVTAHLREQERIRELDIQNQYMETILESTSSGMITVDQMGRVVQVNSRAKLLLDLPDHPVGKLFGDYVSENFDISAALQTGKGFSSREIVTRKNGPAHFASLDPIVDPDGKLIGAHISITEKNEVIRVATEMTGSQAHFTFDSIIGSSEKMQSALHVAKVAATNDATVLITGKTGTGKELFAQAIHNESERNSNPFVAINCGAIPKELIESELFGYEEGAFTGAQQGGRPGKFELADNGTLFLDEIGDMPFDMQVKLLRVLQTGEIQRIGGLRTISVNLRVIAATNKDLKKAISEQEFREDLYYRICTLKINVPSLNERGEDIQELARYFLNRLALQTSRPLSFKFPETVDALSQRRWPGNIRQLESSIERAVHLADTDELLPEHFDMSPVAPGSSRVEEGDDEIQPLAEVEKQALLKAMKKCGGNISLAAKMLAVSRPTIYRKLEKYNIEMEEE